MKRHIPLLVITTIFTAFLVSVPPTISNQIKADILAIREQMEKEEAVKWSLNERYNYETASRGDQILYLDAEEESSIEITLKNTGKLSWFLDEAATHQFVLGAYGENGYKSVSVLHDPDNENWITSDKYAVKDKNKKQIIEPGDEVSFDFEIKAPTLPGVYKETFDPLLVDYKWLNNENITWTVVVGGDFSKSYNYEIENNVSSIAIGPETTREIEMILKNTGATTWYRDEAFPIKLVTEDERAEQLFQITETVVAELEGKEVDPGETGTFNFTFNAPAATGTYPLNLNLAIPSLFTLTTKPIELEIKVTDKLVALTFDDGYGDIDAFLDILKEKDVKATFFMLGVVAQNNPEAMKRIVEEGHLLACHSYNHPDFRGLSASGIRSQLQSCRDAIIEATDGYDPYPYFRYPYGARNAATNAVLAEEGWLNFHWTNGTGDFKYHASSAAGRNHILYYSTLNPPDHANVLMHIISKSSLAVLPDIIDRYQENGYAIVTVAEM